jgi:hypothetical protein
MATIEVVFKQAIKMTNEKVRVEVYRILFWLQHYRAVAGDK